MQCPTCGRFMQAFQERKDQRGLAQDLRVLRSHGHGGRKCAGSGKRVASDDPRLVPSSVWSRVALENHRMQHEIERLQRDLARRGPDPRPRIEVM